MRGIAKLAPLLLVLLALLGVYAFESYTYNNQLQRLNHYLPSLLSPHWTMDATAAEEVLDHLQNVEGLSAATLLHENREVFVSVKAESSEVTGLEGWLLGCGLIHTNQAMLPLARNGTFLGYLRARWINRNLYLYAYASAVLAVLIMITLHQSALQEANARLETEVGERRRVQEDLRASEELYRSLIDHIPIGVAFISRDLKVLSINDVMRGWFPGVDPTTCPTCYVVFNREGDEKPCPCCPALRSIEDGAVHEETVERMSETGRQILRIISSPVRDGSGEIIGAIEIQEDITEQRSLETNLRQAEKMQAIGHLAGGVAHDFNNQLASIMGFTELLLEEVPPDSATWKFGERVLRAAKRSRDLTAQLLAFARKGRYQVEPVDMHGVIAETVSLLSHALDKRIQIVQHLNAHPPYTLGDSTQLVNALLNLGINGSDAMEEGGVLTFATAVVEESLDLPTEPANLDRSRCLCITVQDTGSGMDEETRTHIFEPFFTTKETGKGTGMGLAAVYGTVQSHHGQIEVKSSPEDGTSFVLHLPLLHHADDAPLDVAAARKAELAAAILVVDDEVEVREMVSLFLERRGFTVFTCENGRQALEFLSRRGSEIDLVILDMIMPELSGYDAYLKMQDFVPEIPVLLASGYSMNREAQELLDRGARAFLQKPFQFEALLETVQSALSSKGD